MKIPETVCVLTWLDLYIFNPLDNDYIIQCYTHVKTTNGFYSGIPGLYIVFYSIAY